MAGLLIAGAIGGALSLAGGLLGSRSAKKKARQLEKAAYSNYQTAMGNIGQNQKKLSEDMTSFEKDAADYRATMLNQMIAGGGFRVDSDNRQQIKELTDYTFDTEEIDYQSEYEKLDPYQEGWYNKDHQARLQRKSDIKTDEADTKALGNALLSYEGKQAEFADRSQTAASLVAKESISELQKDINRTYQLGMTEIYNQRQQAMNDYHSRILTARSYEAEGVVSLWNALLKGTGQVADGYIEYRWGK